MPISSSPEIPDPDSPGFVKSPTRGGGGPPGGGPGGPPGGGFGGFSGIRPQIFRGLQGMGDNIPIVARRMGIPIDGAIPGVPGRTGAPAFMDPGQPISQAPAMPTGYAAGGFVPGLSGGPPAPQDTVPAALTPGEMVMNPGVTANPTIAGVLSLLNLLGVDVMNARGAGMGLSGDAAEDNMEGEDCPHCGGKMKPGEEPDEQGMACGGHVKGYAFGGFAGFSPSGRGGFGRFSPFGGASPAAPKGGTTTTGGAQPANNGYTYNNRGGVTGGFNQANPWGHFTENRDTSIYGSWARQMGNAGAAGVYDPRGNQALLRASLEGAQGDADALVRRNVAAADLGGMDPAQRAVARLQAVRESGRGVQDIMAQTRANALGSADQFYKNLAGQMIGADTGFIGADNAAEQQRMTQRANRPSGLSQLGQLAGTAAGAYLSGGTSLIPRP